MNDDITVRALVEDDWEAFRDMRLHSLRTEPQSFASSLERELQFDEATWRSRLDGERKCVFGLFDGETLVGITAVHPHPDDESGATAALAASYILPPYRGRGLSARYFQVRIAFAQRLGFEHIIVSRRDSNEISKRAILRAGFVEVSRVSKAWNDGVTEDHVHYSLVPKNSIP